MMSDYTGNSLFGKPFLSAIIVAAGKSERMGGVNKQFALLDGIPVLAHSLIAFEKCETVNEIIVVTRKENINEIEEMCSKYSISKLSSVVIGGDTRAESVNNGVKAVSENCSFIAVHDGARPLIKVQDIENCSCDAFSYGAAILAVPVTDTIKYGKKNGFIEYTPIRDKLFAAQTPQIFDLQLYKIAVERAFRELHDWTDDSKVFENDSRTVYITEGSKDNIKITTPEDLIIAQALITHRKGE